MKRESGQCGVVAYYRVSTAKQGELGLGMEAQRRLVREYARARACEIVKEYQEVETGKDSTRPQLALALAYAKRQGCTLVIGTLDRLGRKVHLISGLIESGVPFVAADSPNDSTFVLHIKASVAEEEGRKISERTTRALAELKARGVRLGKPDNLTQSARQAGAAANRERALTQYGAVTPLVVKWRDSGMTLRQIADQLNGLGKTTRNGAEWTACAVKRVLDRSRVLSPQDA